MRREELPKEIESILQAQELAGERLVNYVRLTFGLFSLAVTLLQGSAQTHTANLIYGTVLVFWLCYAVFVFWLLGRKRYFGWLKYASVTVDITVCYVAMVGNLFNHSGPYEVFRNPGVWIAVAAFNVMAGLRNRVGVSLWAALLTLVLGLALLGYVRLHAVDAVWVHSAIYLHEGLSVREYLNNLVMVATPAVFAAVIAANSRRLIVQAARESMARTVVEQERDRLTKYFSREVVDLVLQDPSSIGLGGRRMHATVLFSDIRNFTRLAEGLEPEEVVDVLNRYFTRMVDIVFAHGGTLDKFIGDGLMALFGVPYPMERPEECAVRAALDMVAALDEFNVELVARGRSRIEIGIGINAGPVVAGNIGSSLRHEYTVIGDAVNLAARLEGLAKAESSTTQVLVSEAVYRALAGRFEAPSLGRLPVRGRMQEVEVFSITPRDGRAARSPSSPSTSASSVS